MLSIWQGIPKLLGKCALVFGGLEQGVGGLIQPMDFMANS